WHGRARLQHQLPHHRPRAASIGRAGGAGGCRSGTLCRRRCRNAVGKRSPGTSRPRSSQRSEVSTSEGWFTLPGRLNEAVDTEGAAGADGPGSVAVGVMPVFLVAVTEAG